MRRLGFLLFLSSILVLFAPAAEKDFAGTYAGDWTGGSASGELRMTLEQTDSKWKCEASFTLGGQDVKTTMKSLKVEDAKIEIQYEFDLQGNRLQSTLTGQLEGRTLEGKYKTIAVADSSPVDEGVWKVTAKQ